MDLKSITNSLQGELTHEMIHTQTDVSFAKEVEKELDKIIDIVNTNDFNFEKLLKNTTLKTNMDNVNKILSKRFGINIRFMHGTNVGLCTYVVYPPDQNTLYGSALDMMEILKTYGKKSDTAFDTKEMYNYDSEYKKMYTNLYTSFKSLENKLKTDKIVIDLKNAKIHNLPSDYCIYIQCDFNTYFNYSYENIKSNEMMGGILHEIGHSFTAIEKSLYSVKNTMVLFDTIRESINNENKDFVNVLKVSYNKITGEKFNKGDTLDLLLATKSLLDGYRFTDDKRGQNANISAEQNADQFASRFGYGKEIVMLLSKWENFLSKDDEGSIESMYNESPVLLVLLLLFQLIYTAGVGIVFWYIIDSLGVYWNMEGGKVYDNVLKRYLRVKQDAIRQIRLLKNTSIPKEVVERLLNTVEYIDNRIKVLTIDKDAVNKFLSIWKGSKRTKAVTNMLDLTEMFTENDLHYYNLKLKNKLS